VTEALNSVAKRRGIVTSVQDETAASTQARYISSWAAGEGMRRAAYEKPVHPVAIRRRFLSPDRRLELRRSAGNSAQLKSTRLRSMKRKTLETSHF
jgi:hypothetical protein